MFFRQSRILPAPLSVSVALTGLLLASLQLSCSEPPAVVERPGSPSEARTQAGARQVAPTSTHTPVSIRRPVRP